MYEPFFQLKQRTFLPGPSATRFFPATAIEQAREALVRCIQRTQGAGLLVGPTGTGKTLLCQVLAQQFQSSHRVVLLAGTKLCTRRALLQSVLFELNLSYRDMSEAELRLELAGHLEAASVAARALLLIVDEADTLPLRLLEELRMLTNIVADGVPRVQLVLAGGPALEERLTGPRFESFSQRVAARCYLQPLNRDETMNYVAWQVEVAGGELSHVFEPSALDAIYETTDGIPRLINQVCDYALQVSAAAGQQPLTGETIRQAWSELQQLPSPWLSHASASVGTTWESADEPPSIIEFQALDELPPLGNEVPATSETATPVAGADHDTELETEADEDERVVELPDSAPLQRNDEPSPITTAESSIDVGLLAAADPLHELVTQTIIGDDYRWPEPIADESPKVPDLRIVLDETTGGASAGSDTDTNRGSAVEASALDDFPNRPARRFDQLFTRLRRRRSA